MSKCTSVDRYSEFKIIETIEQKRPLFNNLSNGRTFFSRQVCIVATFLKFLQTFSEIRRTLTEGLTIHFKVLDVLNI